MNRKSFRYLCAAAGAVLWACVSCGDVSALSGRMRGENAVYRGEDAEAAPEFALRDLNNDIFTLSQYRDRKPVIVFFWTTWCVNCREGMRVLNEMYPRIIQDNFEVISINVGEHKSKVERFVQAHDLRFKVLLDTSTETARAYNLVGVPTYVIMDRKGQVRFYGHFFPQADYRKLAEE